MNMLLKIFPYLAMAVTGALVILFLQHGGNVAEDYSDRVIISLIYVALLTVPFVRVFIKRLMEYKK